MKKILTVLEVLILLLVVVSCSTTGTYMDESKVCSFVPEDGTKSEFKLIDETFFAQGSTESGNVYYSYYTKSQWEFDMFEFGMVSVAEKADEDSKSQMEFYYGDYETDTWTLAGTWDEVSYAEFDDSSLPIIFIKPNKDSVILSGSFAQDDILSGKVYIKKWFDDYKVTYKFASGEEVSSYFKTSN